MLSNILLLEKNKVGGEVLEKHGALQQQVNSRKS